MLDGRHARRRHQPCCRVEDVADEQGVTDDENRVRVELE
jgi:hypothetical protein